MELKILAISAAAFGAIVGAGAILQSSLLDNAEARDGGVALVTQQQDAGLMAAQDVPASFTSYSDDDDNWYEDDDRYEDDDGDRHDDGRGRHDDDDHDDDHGRDDD